MTVLDTTEVRWFAPGSIPPDIRSWFAASTGTSEVRCDTYLLDGRDDIGVKRRCQSRLELKVRQSIDGYVVLGGGLAAPLEVWRRQCPSPDLAEIGDGHWVDVCKSIVKRRFRVDGQETDYEPVEAAGGGCDVEIAEVAVGRTCAWTFAFEAFGPLSGRRDSILASWNGLTTSSPCPERFGVRAGRAMGYPEWLLRTISTDQAAACVELTTSLAG